MRLSDKQFGLLMTVPGIIFLIFLCFYPIFKEFWLSFLMEDFIHPTRFVGLNNFLRLLNNRLFWLSIKNTFPFFLGSTAISFFISLLLAHSIHRISRGKLAFRSISIIPFACPLIVSGFIWKFMFQPSYGYIPDLLMKLGMNTPLNIFGSKELSMLGVILADAWWRIPFLTIILLAGLEGIPEELYEAAKIDGADSISQFKNISLPLNRGPMSIGLFFTALFASRTFTAIFSMTGGGPGKGTYVFAQYIFEQGNFYQHFGVMAACSIMFMGVVVGIGVYFMRKVFG